VSPWGWKPERTLGIWRYGCLWLRPIVSSAPYLTILFLLALIYCLSNALPSATGLTVSLPATSCDEVQNADFTVLLLPKGNDTIVLFDDSRYFLKDDLSMAAFVDHLSGRVLRVKARTLLVLADRHVPTGDLMQLMSVARRSGIANVLIAENPRGNR